MSLAITLHLLAAVLWVGGMFFAYTSLRPAAASVLEPPLRLNLWVQVFRRFFPMVWGAVLLLPLTGYWLTFSRFGEISAAPLYVHLMNGLGSVMILIFLHVFFAPYRRLCQAVDARDWPTGGKKLSQIRYLVGLNTMLGGLVIILASTGRYW